MPFLSTGKQFKTIWRMPYRRIGYICRQIRNGKQSVIKKYQANIYNYGHTVDKGM